MTGRPTDGASRSRLADVTAPAILQAFDAYRDGFRAITGRAGTRFEERDWHASVADAVERLDLYGTVVDGIERDVRDLLGQQVTDEPLWSAIKAVYSGLIGDREDRELAETFCNSVTRRVFATVGVDPEIEFVDTDFDTAPSPRAVPVCRTYEAASGDAELIGSVLRDGWFDAPFEDVRRDAELAAARVADHLRSLAPSDPRIRRIEMVTSPFFRRKGAYLVGRVVAGGGPCPLVLALLNSERGIVVDAVLTDENDVSILFSFTQSHFHVDVEPPHELVGFLHTLLPQKRIAELYIAVGFHKHGKTELYRDLLRHLRSTDERFALAPGTPGLIMVVFAMPGFDLVFKVIRDRFPATKSVTRRGVMRQYRLVFRHDRAGRLVEAQEFEHLKFDRGRFAPKLLEELEREASRAVDVGPDSVVLHHAYVERRVTPLDLFVREAPPEAAAAAVVDLGQAIKDLAATDIFPGDLLPKNFGLTRLGRIVCYDYDELALLGEFCFRRFPGSEADGTEFPGQTWFGVGPRDVFPEEFPTFISLPPPLGEAFARAHGDLYVPEFWTGMQERQQAGEIVDIFPYHASRRLRAETP